MIGTGFGWCNVQSFDIEERHKALWPVSYSESRKRKRASEREGGQYQCVGKIQCSSFLKSVSSASLDFYRVWVNSTSTPPQQHIQFSAHANSLRSHTHHKQFSAHFRAMGRHNTPLMKCCSAMVLNPTGLSGNIKVFLLSFKVSTARNHLQ